MCGKLWFVFKMKNERIVWNKWKIVLCFNLLLFRCNWIRKNGVMCGFVYLWKNNVLLWFFDFLSWLWWWSK